MRRCARCGGGHPEVNALGLCPSCNKKVLPPGYRKVTDEEKEKYPKPDCARWAIRGRKGGRK